MAVGINLGFVALEASQLAARSRPFERRRAPPASAALQFSVGHVLAPLWVTAHYRAATTATPRRHDGAGGGEELRA
jgi:hypothetical protein